MTDRILSAVADAVGVSRSTVSKAVNHCPGVGGELREEILRTADVHGLRGKKTSSCEAYVILPETPAYFWGELYALLLDALRKQGIEVKFNIYSRLGDEKTVLRYLEEAERLDARLIILAAQFDGLEARLRELTRSRAVFSVCKRIPTTNVFCFGSDDQANGRLLAGHCLKDHPQAQRFLLIGREDGRTQGFAEGVSSAQVRAITPSTGESAAALAGQLMALRREFPFDAVICLDGTTARTCQALKKCRLNLPCYGFEQPVIEPRYGLPAGEVCQDLAAIAAETARAAARYLRRDTYPDTKYICVPPRYVRRTE